MDKNSSKITEKADSGQTNGLSPITALQSLNIAVEFGFIIVVPLLVLGYFGKWMDQKYDTGYFVVIGLITALILSTLMLYRKINAIIENLKNIK